MPDPRIWPIENATDTYFQVTNASQVCLNANDRRRDTDFVNDSDYIIYLARGNAAVIGSGIRINAKGGSYHIGTNNLFKGDIYAIADIDLQVVANMTISEGLI